MARKKIGIVTAYPPLKSGMAVYAKLLTEAMARQNPDFDLVILAEYGGEKAPDSRLEVIPCFSRKDIPNSQIIEKALSLGLDLVCLQHMPDIFGEGDDFFNLMRGLTEKGIRVTISLHGVFYNKHRLHHALEKLTDGIIVHHEKSMRQFLISEGVKAAKIVTIPHGTEIVAPQDITAAKKEIDASDKLVILYTGFIWTGKGIPTIIKAMRHVKKIHKNALFIIAGSPANPKALDSRIFLQYLKFLSQLYGVSNQIRFTVKYLSDEELETYYSAADLVVLPNKQNYSTASSILHCAVGRSRPVICSSFQKFEDYITSVGEEVMLPTYSPRAWGEKIADFLTRIESLSALRGKIAEFARQTTWEVSARKHIEFFKTKLPT